MYFDLRFCLYFSVIQVVSQTKNVLEEYVESFVIMMNHATTEKYVKTESVNTVVETIMLAIQMNLVLRDNAKVTSSTLPMLIPNQLFIFFSTLNVNVKIIFPDPCQENHFCGVCSECNILDHRMQCSCSTNYTGNPLVECKRKRLLCDGYCPCDESGYCITVCDDAADCPCGETCFNGGCRSICSTQNKCPERQICLHGVCIPGCNTDLDCGDDMTCSSKLCVNVCRDATCGKNAICTASHHRSICSCPGGFSGDPLKECIPYDCLQNEDCNTDEKCSPDGKCVNVCSGACGTNAICRSVNRRAQCSCPNNYKGNPKAECVKDSSGSCLRNPCGVNARCRDYDDGSYECTCPQGCAGNPQRQCFCGTMEPCAYKSCGTNAQCRIDHNGDAHCYCPRNYPNGDPNFECKLCHKSLVIYLNKVPT